jgi:hypothetical protein
LKQSEIKEGIAERKWKDREFKEWIETLDYHLRNLQWAEWESWDRKDT